ncbi:probable LRR receptor-like serine/threonine-protein kinase At1g06840 isoform X2 [Nicotiana tomentosiformis]|uniref:non-specific serine/threonine protein kinase n=1 Tax=Nicotiana tabacum TaxID=4097 RepID=A0A1S3YZ04_TOBAC|nr:probable LRR receptor-like serine/threonine-protein kinase At1g06840 isoform X2 [Nicotiana tomentosiformis]XP_016457419.1 PREDICTED: probable LRR receptor-like serine/threonine-protein kinase At1g06840 isoform X2 [Nicotiana tabacum]XP_018632161.1 probable LRR receptor-like serine/threonine-protein kinase At1g06840 isoform X2 [Nicotiana tomentosiformis]XP_033516372.1 probable LRR receptor-like serine/threonine-protein kinase At1g06840 isoform X2 [Nicotiana tomentosiformis]
MGTCMSENCSRFMNKNLSGSLAPELGQLSHLQILNFMWNDLTGSIPKEIGNIKPLRLLLLNGNQLSGSLADELGYLPDLNRFQIDQNKISGEIPKTFSNLNRIRHIHFNNNSLSGQIPHELSNLSTLLHLLLDNNNLSGFLPPEFSALPDLEILQLDNNNFSGSEIPATYGNLSSLLKLSLRNCFLQGSVSDFSRIGNLSYLDLSWNQLSGSIPQNKLSNNMTTIILAHNHLNGSVPKSFSLLPSLQKLSLENNFLNGSISTDIWQNRTFATTSRLVIDLRNNSVSNISGAFDPPVNVTLRFQGNPICSNRSIRNIDQYCGPDSGADDEYSNSTNPSVVCPIQACPTDNYYEYVPASPQSCFCASPLRIGYRLKSPSISYFDPYMQLFQSYVTSSLDLDLYQLWIDSYFWEKGPRLRMHLKLFPVVGFSTFNESEVLRISEIFASWEFPGSDLFGPYELLNFTLLGPYSYLNPEIQSKRKSKGVLIACIVAAGVFAAIVSTIVTILISRRRAKYQSIMSRKRLSTKLSIKIDGVKSFTFREMALATNNFDSSTQVGEGGYGSVFRGVLADKKVVAIKRAKEGSLQGQKEFLTEIELLSRLHHRNLVVLLGYCDEEGEQMLVYEFMPNGTLRDWLSAKSKQNLKFGARLRIALGAAKGILYLHTEADPPIFHRDIKASNILLDSKLSAKVADFGLSRLAPVQDDEGVLPNHVSTMVKGTPGYLDPEYFLTRKMTDKSDVYSLGVVFLEILTGMHPISHGKNIVREVNMAHKSGTVFSIMDNRMGSYPAEWVEKFVALALKCCQDKPEDRPSMLEVVRTLETILRMMPYTDADPLDNKASFGETTSSSSFSNTRSRDLFESSNASGGDLISGVTLTITPR